MKTTLAYSIGGSTVLAFWIITDLITGNEIIVQLFLIPVFIIFFIASKKQKKKKKEKTKQPIYEEPETRWMK